MWDSSKMVLFANLILQDKNRVICKQHIIKFQFPRIRGN